MFSLDTNEPVFHSKSGYLLIKIISEKKNDLWNTISSNLTVMVSEFDKPSKCCIMMIYWLKGYFRSTQIMSWNLLTLPLPPFHFRTSKIDMHKNLTFYHPQIHPSLHIIKFISHVSISNMSYSFIFGCIMIGANVNLCFSSENASLHSFVYLD